MLVAIDEDSGYLLIAKEIQTLEVIVRGSVDVDFLCVELHQLLLHLLKIHFSSGLYYRRIDILNDVCQLVVLLGGEGKQNQAGKPYEGDAPHQPSMATAFSRAAANACTSLSSLYRPKETRTVPGTCKKSIKGSAQ